MLTDVVVVGGGIIGLTIAERLAREGLDVSLLDRGEPGGHRSGGGLLAPVLEPHAPRPLVGLVGDAAHRWPEWLEDVDLTDGVPVALGLVSVAESPFHRQELETVHRSASGSPAEVEWLLRDDLHHLVPGLAGHVEAGLYWPQVMRTDPDRLYAAVLRAAEQRGVRMRWGTPVLALEVRGDRAHGVRTPGEIVPGGAVILATGAQGAWLSPDPSAPLPIVPERWTRATVEGVMAPPVPVHGRGRMVLPGLGGTVVVRGAPERAGFRAVPLVGAVRHTLDAADLYPPLADGRIVGLDACLTPWTPDGLPVLGQFEQVTGLMAAIEVGEYGALLAPLMADVVAAELLSIAVPFDLAPFRPDRWF